MGFMVDGEGEGVAEMREVEPFVAVGEVGFCVVDFVVEGGRGDVDLVGVDADYGTCRGGVSGRYMKGGWML